MNAGSTLARCTPDGWPCVDVCAPPGDESDELSEGTVRGCELSEGTARGGKLSEETVWQGELSE